MRLGTLRNHSSRKGSQGHSASSRSCVRVGTIKIVEIPWLALRRKMSKSISKCNFLLQMIGTDKSL